MEELHVQPQAKLPKQSVPALSLAGVDLVSAFDLAESRVQRHQSGQVCIYSHPAFWRSYFDKEIEHVVGRATRGEYNSQNGRVRSYYERLSHGEKYLIHEDNFSRQMELSCITSIDMIITIPCDRVEMVTSDAFVCFASGGEVSHLTRFLQTTIAKTLERLGPVRELARNPAQFAFLPTNSFDGHLHEDLQERLGIGTEAWENLQTALHQAAIIPGGGIVHQCLSDTLTDLAIGPNRLLVEPDLLYTDDRELREDTFGSRSIFTPLKMSGLRARRLANLMPSEE